MSAFVAHALLRTETASVWDVVCRGECRHKSDEECSYATHLVFPYRGVYVHHVGRVDAVAEANQVLFINRDEAYRISHPVAGGDASLSLAVGASMLEELAPHAYLQPDGEAKFKRPCLPIDARAQALVALLRHSLSRGIIEALEAETLSLTLVRRALGQAPARAKRISTGRRKLVDRAKLVLSSNLSRRWTLSAIATEVGVSPVYLTQLFQQVEGVPLYRYQLRLRLARALDLLGNCRDLTQLGLDLGFSSHSHFGAAFRRAFGRTPADFQRSAQLR